MMPERYFDAFDRCFTLAGNQPLTVYQKSALFCAAQWIYDAMGYHKEFGQADFDRALKSDDVREKLNKLGLNQQQKDVLYGLCQMIRICDFVRIRAKLFYQLYLPCVVTDTSLFANEDCVQIPLLINGPISCTMIHIALHYAKEQGCRDLLSLHEVFERHKTELTHLGIDYDSLEYVWYAVHGLDARNPMRKRTKVEQVRNTYRKFGVPYTILLEQYAQVRNFESDELKRVANPWEYVGTHLNLPRPESGMTKDEELFNDGAYQISLYPPTDVIQTLFYPARDDSRIESALIHSEMRWLKEKTKSCLIVNPSPAFMVEFDALWNPDDSTGFQKSNVTIAVTHKVVAYLYGQQYPEYNFVLIEELEEIHSDFGHVVVLARDHELDPLWLTLPLCREKGYVTFLLPQTTLTDPEHRFMNCLLGNDIHPDWILDVPTKLTGSKPRKKILISARKGDIFAGRNINLLSAVAYGNENNYSYTLEKEQYCVPPEMLSLGLTFAQMRSKAKKAKNSDEIKLSKESKIYAFSKEIHICYNLIYVEGKLDRARAYYRNIHRPEVETTRTKGRRPNDIKTERGLRGKTEGEILGKLEQVALYDEYYDHIVADIKDFYRTDLSRLTVKSMWFCCRQELLTRISYDDSIAMELFCTSEQSLSDLISGSCQPDEIVAAMEALYGPDGASKKEWLQLHLIFQTGVEEGLVEKNPLASVLHVVQEESRKRVYMLNAALRKSHFTDAEEHRMVDYLRAPITDRTGVCAPRYVVESKWLAGAFSLFAGLPVREICPLCWGDLRRIDDMEEMQLAITKHLNNSDAVISNMHYANKHHFRQVAIDLMLGRMLLERKQYLMDKHGYTEESLADLPIMLETEPYGRGRRKHTMITKPTVRKVNHQLITIAQIPSDLISLLEGDARFDVDLNAQRNDLFAANFRHKAYHTCGFTTGELCHHTGNKSPDTFSRHYCDYGNDFLQYNMIHKLYRWTYIYDRDGHNQKMPSRTISTIEKSQEYGTGRYANGLAHAELDIEIDQCTGGRIRIEIECEHGLDGIAVAFGKEGNG